MFAVMALLMFITSFSQPVNAVVIGINKMRIDYKNMLRAGYAQDTVRITTDSSDPVFIDYIIEGYAKDWITIKPEVINVTASKPALVTIIVQPPSDVANGNYSATVRFLTKSIGTPSGQFGASVIMALPVNINIEITGVELKSCSIGGFSIPDFEIRQPLVLHYSVHNTGNVRVKPELLLEVWDRDFENIVLSKHFTSDEVLPTVIQDFEEIIDNDLSIGQYWAVISSSECTGQGKLTFDVLQVGGVSDKGELLRLELKPKARTGELLEVAAAFKNLGSRSVLASMQGKVEFKGKIVKLLTSQELRVNPGETTMLKDYFKPLKPGVYKVSARVKYNNKLTFEKSETVLVEGPALRQKPVAWDLIIGVVLIIIIIALLFLIERKKRYERQRRIF